MSVWFILPISMLALLSACYPQSIPSPGESSPTDTTPVTNITNAYIPIPTMTRPMTKSTLTPIKPASITADSVEEVLETPMAVSGSLTITIVYDNNAYDDRLKTAWGFSALVEYRDLTLLFDTGGDGPTLMGNMHTLGINPNQIESVVLSHAHGDHTGGLSALLQAGSRPVVYMLPSFSKSFKYVVSRTTKVIEVRPGLSIVEGISTTGEMGNNIPEQSLAIQTDQGLVVITGCAHPGIVMVLEHIRKMVDDPVYLVLGGFHLGSKSEAEIDSIMKDFRRMGVEQVGPCHCTGDLAAAMFATEYGMNFIQTGVGKIIKLDAKSP
jgi:7,8-dihydropterin-6-yl-methyl-4-(beta-D-ribofuranosyl)aminobenzene 5'-phosphate synthase